MKNFLNNIVNKQVLLLSFIVIFGFILYGNCLKADFLRWDDTEYILNNPQLGNVNLEGIKQIFRSYVHSIYIPLTIFSYAIEYHVFGFNPYYFHLTNLILHLIICLLIYKFARQMNLNIFASFFSSLLFLIHPSHVESVCWLSSRKDLLYSLFYLLSMTVYVDYYKSIVKDCKISIRIFYILCFTILGALSALSKPMAVSLPIILCLIDWFNSRKINLNNIVDKIPLFIAMIIIGFITYKTQMRIHFNVNGALNGLLLWGWCFVFYIKQFLFPLVFVPLYRPSYPLSFLNLSYCFSILLILLIILSVYKFRRSRLYCFSILFYVFSIFFLLRVDLSSDTTVVSDRYMYLPQLGWVLLIGLLIEKIWNLSQRYLRCILMLFVIIGFCFMSIKTFCQVKIWRNTATVWIHQLKNFPNEYIALNNLANFLQEQRDYRQAIVNYRQSILSGRQVDVQDEKKVKTILDLYARAVLVSDSNIDITYNIAMYYESIGLTKEAMVSYGNVISKSHDYKDAHLRLLNLFDQ